jgi:3alpha(or 20beta)-hydroxysteroid dehydrogenase
MDRLKDKIAIVTGAGSGQGAAEARLFAAEGAQVVLTDLNAEGGEVVAGEIGAKALFIPHDISDEDGWRKVVGTVLDRFGRIDVLVNNAGVYRQKTFQETDRALLDFHYNVNVLGTFLGMQAVYPPMRDQGGGAIINVSSGAALRGYPGLFAYASSKWMVRGLSKCAAVDLAESNIRVNTILPGLIDTPMLAGNTSEYIEYLNNIIPAKRLGTADEVAHAALYLASDDARYVMGAEITVCGAVSA